MLAYTYSVLEMVAHWWQIDSSNSNKLQCQRWAWPRSKLSDVADIKYRVQV